VNPATVRSPPWPRTPFDDLAENLPVSPRHRQTFPTLAYSSQSGTSLDRALSASMRKWDNPDRRARHPHLSFHPQPIGSSSCRHDSDPCPHHSRLRPVGLTCCGLLWSVGDPRFPPASSTNHLYT